MPAKKGVPRGDSYRPPAWWLKALESKVGKLKPGRPNKNPEPGIASRPQIARDTGLSIEQVGRLMSNRSVTIETVMLVSRVYEISSPVWMAETEEEAVAIQAALFRIADRRRISEVRPTGNATTGKVKR